jgi:amino acid transporter
MQHNQIIIPLSVFFGVFLLLIIFYYVGKPKIVTEDDEDGKPKVVAKKAIPLALIISSVLGAITTLVMMYMGSGKDSDNNSNMDSDVDLDSAPRTSRRRVREDNLLYGMKSRGMNKRGMKYYF